mgnify:CR=1 FL=1
MFTDDRLKGILHVMKFLPKGTAKATLPPTRIGCTTLVVDDGKREKFVADVAPTYDMRERLGEEEFNAAYKQRKEVLLFMEWFWNNAEELVADYQRLRDMNGIVWLLVYEKRGINQISAHFTEEGALQKAKEYMLESAEYYKLAESEKPEVVEFMQMLQKAEPSKDELTQMKDKWQEIMDSDHGLNFDSMSIEQYTIAP